MILFIFLVVLAYLMGSICSAVIVCKACSLPDPRTAGSKNPGATNVLRIAGKQYAALVMVADLLKGTIPVLIAKILGAGPATVGFTALAAVIGHMYPVFFDFKGGKGVATAIGALLGFHFIVGILVAATWLIVAKFSRYASLASITAIGFAPFYSLLLIQRLDIFLPIFIMALLVVYKHKENIVRLIDKKEPHIKLKEDVLDTMMEGKAEHAVPPQKPEPMPQETIIEIEEVIITETVVAEPEATKTAKTAKKPSKKTEESEKKTRAKKTAAPKAKTKKPEEK
ncbi:glycerol-3-phosphate 1-O-acyltransferase PlsY [Legionella anisa]|uniref:Glycerol-3-phosphate acyltransferase n=1 Tax=Legionella anisa TaxID=28082 RepID=A0AAX0WWE7_9GAMM|nr:glycerol-3-phosphate 1-O-acyltransferase PlsY [Legionella anisa]AWN73280.1 acyl-phosphate glycerol 3-phosphate acyltransferase [Legionella anisa]KTC69908.1 transmembrane protein [Legionella anisa]MBN5936689.1 glycerol-3-phosphate 1-O-acyltransferase PlsY [Legionella anisa]MCW8423057.1 glycerol-3-phosphate 1-O-acyltransferase PlsY [Legionella anisa]MCW8447800.1 glycerol-3-phosphate 1-O-acyltransferase PlsY [Legionella anisa]